VNNSQPLRWGVIGLGIGEQHATTINVSPSMQLTALCDLSSDALASVGRRFDSAVRFTDEFELIRSGAVDAVVIASYDNRHAEAIVAALDSGIHVFCEKPIATSRRQLEEVVEALNRNPSLHLMTNTLLRRSPRFAWLKDQIASGGMGSVYHAELTYLYGRLSKVLEGWRGNDHDYSVTLGGTIHLIDLLMWLVDERPQSLMGIGGSTGTSRSALYDPDRHLVQDLRMALMEFPSGITAAVSANYACVLPHFHRVEVYGTSGTFMNVPPLSSSPEDSAAYLYSSRDPDEPPLCIDLPYPAVPKSALIPRFVRTIRGGDPEISEQAIVEAVAVALAVDDAVLSGEPVVVSYPEVLPRKNLD
jgi:predicted dehydrogenase